MPKWITSIRIEKEFEAFEKDASNVLPLVQKIVSELKKAESEFNHSVILQPQNETRLNLIFDFEQVSDTVQFAASFGRLQNWANVEIKGLDEEIQVKTAFIKK